MFNCMDCGINTKEIHEYYMVKNYLWNMFVGKSGMLCIGCLEKRMDRELNSNDFLYCPLNFMDSFEKSDRLMNRLTRGISYVIMEWR